MNKLRKDLNMPDELIIKGELAKKASYQLLSLDTDTMN